MRGLSSQWLADVVEALESFGGQAHVSNIYRRVRVIRRKRGDAVPESSDMIVQRTLEDFCSESKNFRNSFDLFRMVHGKGQGVYRLNPTELDRYRARIPPLDDLFVPGSDKDA